MHTNKISTQYEKIGRPTFVIHLLGDTNIEMLTSFSSNFCNLFVPVAVSHSSHYFFSDIYIFKRFYCFSETEVIFFDFSVKPYMFARFFRQCTTWFFKCQFYYHYLDFLITLPPIWIKDFFKSEPLKLLNSSATS